MIHVKSDVERVESELNELGKQGWEVVTVCFDFDRAVLKRRKN